MTTLLHISGVKLDSKNCEALEEVFRRVRTKTLDLENTGLEDDVSLFLCTAQTVDYNLLYMAFTPYIVHVFVKL